MKQRKKRVSKKSDIKVISLSGGRSSAMLLKIMLDNGMVDNNTVVCFANTGRESEATLEFVRDIAENWGIEIVWLEYRTGMPEFVQVDFETASRRDNPIPFDQLLAEKKYLPNAVKRICTAEMKVKTIRRFIRSLGVRGQFDTYLGIRYDEPVRWAKKKAQNAAGKEAEWCVMPLYDMRITTKERNEFWAKQPFDLKIDSHFDNCDLCFMKGVNNLVWSIRNDPESVEWWIRKEAEAATSAKRRRNGQFRKKERYSDLKKLALDQTYIPQPEERNFMPCECGD